MAVLTMGATAIVILGVLAAASIIIIVTLS